MESVRKNLPWIGLCLLAMAVLSACIPDPRLLGNAGGTGGAAIGYKAPEWDYSGPTGPEKWADMKPEWATARDGKAQSPVDITEAQVTTAFFPLKLNYGVSGIDLLNDGRCVRQSIFPGSFIDIGGKPYKLSQFEIHTPSEHLVNGKRYEMEIQLIHEGPDGKPLVLSLLIEQGASDNSFLAQLWPHLPQDAGTSIKRPDITMQVKGLLPQDLAYYFYEGSYTVPPCKEGVHWYILRQPAQASAKQIQTFRQIFTNNSRPVQPLNGRTVWATN